MSDCEHDLKIIEITQMSCGVSLRMECKKCKEKFKGVLIRE